MEAASGVETVNMTSTTTWVKTSPGLTLSIVCHSEQSRPEVTQFQWEVGDANTWASVRDRVTKWKNVFTLHIVHFDLKPRKVTHTNHFKPS